jgi:tetratricopeptide (TPR) repeat protein
LDDSFQKRLARAEALIGIGRYREAIVELGALAGSDPQNSYVLCSLSLCHYELGEFRKALDFAGKAAAADPDQEWAFRLMSSCHMLLGNSREALKAAETAAEIEPEHPYALQSLAYAQIEHFAYNEATETARVLLEIAPDQAETHEVFGYLTMQQAKYIEAERHFLRALAISPESAETLNNLGTIYLALCEKPLGSISPRRYARRARDSFLMALKVKPTFEVAQQNLEIAENNPRFLGGKANGTFFRIHFVVLGLIILFRLIGDLTPPTVALYIPFTPRIFTVGLNFLLVLFLILWAQSFLRRQARLTSVHGYFEGRPIREGLFYLLVCIVLALCLFFLLIIDRGASQGGLLILVIFMCVMGLIAFQIYSRWDGGSQD